MALKILKREDLTMSEKMLLIAILEMAAIEGRNLVALSLEELARLTSLSNMHVSRLIKSLERSNLLYIERDGKRRNMYRVTLEEAQNQNMRELELF